MWRLQCASRRRVARLRSVVVQSSVPLVSPLLVDEWCCCWPLLVYVCVTLLSVVCGASARPVRVASAEWLSQYTANCRALLAITAVEWSGEREAEAGRWCDRHERHTAYTHLRARPTVSRRPQVPHSSVQRRTVQMSATTPETHSPANTKHCIARVHNRTLHLHWKGKHNHSVT